MSVLTFCVLLQEPQQQALPREHVDQAGHQWSFGLVWLRVDLQVCIHHAVFELTVRRAELAAAAAAACVVPTNTMCGPSRGEIT